MKSVGEAMAIGRSFTEALQKALRSLERKGSSFHWRKDEDPSKEQARALLQPGRRRRRTAGSCWCSRPFAAALSVEEVHEATGIDPWFLDQIALINELAVRIAARRRS